MPPLRVCAFVAALAAAAGCSSRPADDASPPRWEKLETEPANDKQDDISFIDAERGWYVKSLGKIFKTVDGGRTWREIILTEDIDSRPQAVAFLWI